jgi:Ni/Fe-hydrogenase subunit HybB-like protein
MSHSLPAGKPAPHGAAESGGDSGRGVILHWQRGVPVFDRPIRTRSFVLLLLLVAAGTAIGLMRLLGGALGPFTGLNDAYAWGVWKTFNVMALTALGSGGMAIGIAAWVFNEHRLHSVMRTALVTSLLFYATGLLGLMTDVGRPWNFWNALVPWRWNTASALWEVSIAMPAYACVFLTFELSPIFVERAWYVGKPSTRALIDRWRPRMRAIYPWAVAGAYVVPMMHQSSLGALMLLAGDKVHPLWQTQILPGLYLLQAGACGFGAVMLFVMGSCLVWRRPLDMKVLGRMGNIMSWIILVWSAVRVLDLALRGKLGHALHADAPALLFWTEMLLVLVPALLLRERSIRRTPRHAFVLALVATFGGVLYRFNPTTITYDPGKTYSYFPTVPELVIMFGLVAMVVAAFSVACKRYAVLPAPLDTWYSMVEAVRRVDPATRRDEHGNPLDD